MDLVSIFLKDTPEIFITGKREHLHKNKWTVVMGKDPQMPMWKSRKSVFRGTGLPRWRKADPA